MKSRYKPIEVPELHLKSCSVDEHCEALIRFKKLSYWWYQGVSKIFGNYSLPFKDKNDNWWYQVKPGLCWPVDIYKTIKPELAQPQFKNAYLGFQHLVPDESLANTRLVFNTIFDMKAYRQEELKPKRCNKIRNGLKKCQLHLLGSYDEKIFDQCRLAWNSLSERTGWKQTAKKKIFDNEWQMLLDCPGVSIIVATEMETGKVAGFMNVKIIGDTAYSDTVAARTDMLHTKVNDALRYSFLANAQKLPSVKKAYSAIKSSLKGLELFKRELGYIPHPFPARTHLCPGLETALKLFSSKKYNRMVGKYEGDE